MNEFDSLQKLLKTKLGKSPKNERETRAGILSLARKQKCVAEIKNIFNKFDSMLAGCTDVTERKHISMLGIVELYKALHVSGGLTINGVEILPADNE